MLRTAITMAKFEFLINQVEVENGNESCTMEILLSVHVPLGYPVFLNFI